MTRAPFQEIVDRLREQAQHAPTEDEVLALEQQAALEARRARGQAYHQALARALPEPFRTMIHTPLDPTPGNQEARRLAEAFTLGRSMFLHGPPGVGKTHLATRMLGRLTLEHGIKAHAWSWPDLLARLRDWRNSDRAPSIHEPDVLLIDDFDKGGGTEFVHERAYDVLQRVLARRSTIVTANRSPLDTAARLGLGDEENTAALVSRFRMFDTVLITGADRRRP